MNEQFSIAGKHGKFYSSKVNYKFLNSKYPFDRNLYHFYLFNKKIMAVTPVFSRDGHF
jgi:hypothetical protein